MGIVERPTERLLDALAGEFAFDPPRHHGYDTVATIAAMAAGAVDVFVGLGGNFAAAAPDTDATAAALRALRADRAGVDEAQPLARHVRRGGADPAVPRAHRSRRRARPAIASSRSRTRWASSMPPAAPTSRHRRICAARSRSSAPSPPPRSVTEPIDWTALAADYDDDPRAHRRDDPGVRRLQRAGAPPGRLRPAQPAARQHDVPDGDGQGAAVGQRVRADRRAAGTPAAADGALARPVQHDDLRPRRPLPRRVAAAGGSCSSTPTTSTDLGPRRRRPRRHRQRVDRRQSSAGPAASGSSPTRRPAGCCAAYFPEANVLVPLDSVAEGSRTPTSKAIVVRLERLAEEPVG